MDWADLPAHIRQKNTDKEPTGYRRTFERKTAQLVDECHGRNKFNAKRTTVGDATYDSKREADVCEQLKLIERAGWITDLEFQVKYRLEVNGVHINDYTLDARYFDTRKGSEYGWHHVDVKSPITAAKRDFKRNVRLMKACHGIDVEVVL